MTQVDPPAPLNFDVRLKEAAGLLGRPIHGLVSLKIRPIKDVGSFDTSYLSPSDYTVINRALAMSSLRRIKSLGFVCHGEAALYELENGDKILYVEHESGPEIILDAQAILHAIAMGAGAVGAVALAANQLVALVNNICKMLQKAPSKKRDSSGRFVATSIEKRLARGQKLIKQIGKTAKASEKAIKSIEELI
jgi:hypothetical protein